LARFAAVRFLQIRDRPETSGDSLRYVAQIRNVPDAVQQMRDEDVATLVQPELNSWMNALVDYVRSGEPDLTNRQMALLLVVYLRPGPHTVRGLARILNVSKPVVTRALNRLGALGYLRRQRDDSDKRNIFVARTSEGADFLEEFGQFIGDGESPPSARAVTA
jgi:DNA-binding MarR family transcriptional regulator